MTASRVKYAKLSLVLVMSMAFTGLYHAITNAPTIAALHARDFEKFPKLERDLIINYGAPSANPAESTKVPTHTAAATQSLMTLEQSVHDQINQHRATRGLPALKLDVRISEKARAHSQDMASGGVPFGHQGFDRRVQAICQVIPCKGAAENVAYNQGQQDPARQAVQQWLQSSGHRRNIEGPYNLTGIGIAKNSRGGYYFTQIFITRP